jgi:type III pantothenate kinase
VAMPDAVVDIGNSRIKICRCAGGSLQLPVRGLSADDLTGWDRVARELSFPPGGVWAVSSTNPSRLKQFTDWVTSRGERLIAIDTPRKVPIGVSLDEPDRVGIDRLLNALAAKSIGKLGQAVVIVDAGSAVTVDFVHEDGNFAGGVIFPGLRLMGLALHKFTAALPLIDASGPIPAGPPGTNTDAAIKLGLLYAVAGGVDAVVRELATHCTSPPHLYLTGGDMTPQLAGLLQSRHQFHSELRPALTLEGILRAAESLS